MKVLFINGSPRKNWSTYKMLESAMKGSVDAGAAEAKLINLYDVAFKGCVSCFACKLKNTKTFGLCAFKDPLTPILAKTHESDIIVIGSPVYFSYPTGLVRSFMERLMFPVLSYNPKTNKESGEMEGRILSKTVATAMIYTMGDTKEHTDELHYPWIFGENTRFLEMLFGYSETLCSYFAYQFGDYSHYDVHEGLEPLRAKQRDEQFPKDLHSAYELGKRLVQKAKEVALQK